MTRLTRVCRMAACGAAILLNSASCTADDAVRSEQQSAESRVSADLADAALAVAWNRLAFELASEDDPNTPPFKSPHAFALMHLAMHDALNTIRPIHERYAYTGERTAADPIAAAARAAHDVLLSQYPAGRRLIAAELEKWLGRVGERMPRRRGIALGRAAAAAVLDEREGDGWDTPGEYAFRDGPGQYRTTPPWDGFVLQPGFAEARPFVLQSASQFRPPAPPLLASAAYARAVNEVKTFGDSVSTARTKDQTGYAVWWMEFAETAVNRLARELFAERGTDLWTANRALAQLNMALFDAYVSVWASKYEYNHWRPYTSIRAAAVDGNPATVAAPDWRPLRPTPPFPEYVSAHAAGCAAAFGILARTLGDDVAFTMETVTAPPGMPTRSFRSFAAAAEECADSRVRLGWHYRYATEAGLTLGRSVAALVAERALVDTAR